MPDCPTPLRVAELGEKYSGLLAIAGISATIICLGLMIIFDKDQESKGRVKELDIATGISAGVALLSCFACVCCFSRCVNRLLPAPTIVGNASQPPNSLTWRQERQPLNTNARRGDGVHTVYV